MPIFNLSEPMIIYIQSPKIIHAEVQDFPTLVQRLTGSTSSSYIRSCSTNNENLTADHDSRIISQASDVTTLSQPAELVDQNMESFRTDHTPCNSNTASLENNRNQEIESGASGPEATDRAQTAVTSLGDSIPITPFSPFCPNFILSSQRLFSPNIFKDLPLFSPDSNNFFYSLSEPMFSPQRSPLNTSTMTLHSPCPTTLDLWKTPPEYEGLLA
jgi:hypothetical protein